MSISLRAPILFQQFLSCLTSPEGMKLRNEFLVIFIIKRLCERSMEAGANDAWENSNRKLLSLTTQ